MNFKAVLPYLLSASTLSALGSVVYENNWHTLITEQPHKTIKRRVEPTLIAPAVVGWEEEEIFRTSDRDRRAREKGVNETPIGYRIGCICMDSIRQNNRGRGACSHHRGVRYWLYEKENGKLHYEPTERHLIQAEVCDAPQKQVEEEQPFDFDLPESLLLLFSGLSMGYMRYRNQEKTIYFEEI